MPPSKENTTKSPFCETNPEPISAPNSNMPTHCNISLIDITLPLLKVSSRFYLTSYQASCPLPSFARSQPANTGNQAPPSRFPPVLRTLKLTQDLREQCAGVRGTSPIDSTISTQSQELIESSNAVFSQNTRRLPLSQKLSATQETLLSQVEEKSPPRKTATLLRSRSTPAFSASYDSEYTTLASNLSFSQLFALPQRLARPTPKPASRALGRARSQGLKPQNHSLRCEREPTSASMTSAGFTPRLQRRGFSPARNCQGHSRLKSGACPKVR